MKMGRPKASNPKNVKYSVRLDKETEERLEAYCKKYGITKGEAVRRAIALMIKF